MAPKAKKDGSKGKRTPAAPKPSVKAKKSREPLTKKKNRRDMALAESNASGLPRLGFIQDVAAASNVAVAAVQKGFEGLKVVIKRHLREKKTCVVPNLVQIVVKIKPAREACTKTYFGKRFQLKARRETKSVKVYASKALREMLV